MMNINLNHFLAVISYMLFSSSLNLAAPKFRYCNQLPTLFVEKCGTDMVCKVLSISLPVVVVSVVGVVDGALGGRQLTFLRIKRAKNI